ncbi:PIR Superfamily Protein [Plasmodium ovale wallikeri]|uniref:PIR Superfamily Protein n=1 Tax=Plasmodium ovale wallikeri TaxID=864142 RepID=A0A1A9ARG5_PLAOA|nr:PIR Superfamily Protein [Plasmodium ovale wallikeri]SBT58720.1 PIR Superfamily Protein [Plasmodium ovale wallikeri]
MTIAFPNKKKNLFFQIIQSNCDKLIPKGELKDKIYQIGEKYFDNMDKIYKLYRIHYELKANDDTKCQNFYDKYEKNYNLSVSKCYTTDEKLRNPLEKFVHFYKFSKLYCSKYKVCKDELDEDLFTIKDNTQKHLGYKETRAQPLDPLYSS